MFPPAHSHIGPRPTRRGSFRFRPPARTRLMELVLLMLGLCALVVIALLIAVGR